MRGSDGNTGSMFSYVDLEKRVPETHPLRLIKTITNDVLASLDGTFEGMYSDIGRPSIPPEQLLRASLLQAFFTIRSERQLMEQLDYNLMFRWFVGLGVDDPVWNHSTFSKNRDRLLDADIAKKVLQAIVTHKKVKPLLSNEHFSVDGTMVQAWASMKSVQPKAEAATGGEPQAGDGEPPEPPPPAATAGNDCATATTATTTSETTPMTTPAQDNKTETKSSRNTAVDFHGQKRRNDTHASTTDADARLYRKGRGKESKLAYLGHALAENRHGLVVNASLTQATGTAERDAALQLVTGHKPGAGQVTLGGDKGYDAAAFVAECRAHNVTPHVAQNLSGRASAIDARTTRHAGYALSQKKRKLIEEAFGWAKTIGGLARPMRRGTGHMAYAFTFAMAAYDLIRLPKLLQAA